MNEIGLFGDYDDILEVLISSDFKKKYLEKYEECMKVIQDIEEAYAFVCFKNGRYQLIEEYKYKELMKRLKNKKSMKINVLGTEYDVEVLKERDEYMKNNTLQGYCDKTSKRIVVCPYDNDFDDKEKLKDSILRHELIHAFLFESGIDRYMLFHSEECVDFFAMQFPKLVKMFEEANCKE